MAQITMSDMLKAGLHFGHQTRRWNPKMKQFILTQRNGIHIINLFKSLDMIDKAYDFIKTTVAHNGTVLFVGTKKQAQEAIANQATRVNMPYVSERWLGGMLTNFQTVSKRVNRLKELEEMDFTDVHGSGLTKKELLLLEREKDKLNKQLGGIRNMNRTPSAIDVYKRQDPTPLLDEIAGLPADQATERIQQIYAEPVKPELITQRLHEIRAAGVTVAGALSPQRTQQFYSTVVDAGVDLFVIRGTVVYVEHVSSGQEPLNLKKFIYDLDVPVIVGGASNYTAALHLMRTGAAGVLVGFGGGAVSATRQTIGVQAPMATAIADVAEARRDYMDESGGRYVQVIADGGMGDSGSFVKALALGADAVMLGAPLARATEAPGKGTHWGSEARHQTLPRGYRTTVGTVGPLEQVLFGPSHQADGKTNFIGALKRAMASTGYVDVKNFQRCGMVVNPYSAR